MRRQNDRTDRPALPWLGLALCLLSGLGCGVIGLAAAPAALAGPSYWAAATATRPPTVTVFLGMTTPVFADTPVPPLLTTTPQWTTVTATPILPPATWTPLGFTATPFWVTTTPDLVTGTPPPPVTTTPALPLIGFTTPEPYQTPYYRIGTFYMNSDVYSGSGRGLVLRLTGHEMVASPRQAGAAYHFVTVAITNHTPAPQLVPAADLFFIRHVWQADGRVDGRWVAQNEPLLARGLPGYAEQLGDPIPPGGTRSVVLGFVVPAGSVRELGLITNWQQPLEGGLPVWFRLRPDPAGPFLDAFQPPPPTPIVLDSAQAPPAPGGPGPGGGTGAGRWPTTGSISRGFGCQPTYTGIDGAGFGCPPDRPWFHNGVDIANAGGSAIWSPVDGAVYFAGPNSTGPDCSAIPGSEPPHEGLGNYQRLGDGRTLHYFGHLSAFIVSSGPVSSGQVVAQMGSSGCSTGSHLHWILYQDGNLVDPAGWAGPGPSP